MSRSRGTVYITNRWAAERMGYSISGVSLLRGGHRQPTLETMEAVQEAFGWPVEDQVKHRRDYPSQLEQWFLRAYEAEEIKKGNSK